MRRLLALASLVAAGAAIAPAAATAGGRAYTFAPYVDLTQYPTPSLSTMARASGVHAMTLAFVVARGTGGCTPTWGGYATDPANGPHPYLRAAIRALRRRNRSAAISFGGQAGTELAAACPTAKALARAYGSVIDAYRPSRVDFDVEGAALEQPAAIARRSGAIATLQKTARREHRRLAVSLTLPVLPSGLPTDARAVVASALSHHVTITTVNLMAMDYGDQAAPHPAGRMGFYAVHAAQNVIRQLHGLMPRATARTRARMIGLTPMIGINDVSTETFTLADADVVESFARGAGIGLVSFWQLERDRACPGPAGPAPTARIDCSGVAQSPYAFAQTLAP